MRPCKMTLMLLILLPAPLAAQQTDDQTRDHELEDQRYYERYLERDEEEIEIDHSDPDAARNAYVSLAEELIRDPNYRSEISEHYRVQTDDPRADVRAAARLLENFRGFFDDFFSDRVELAPYDEPARVFLFYSFHKFNQLIAGDWRFTYFRPDGHYRREFDVLTVHTDPDGREGLPNTLVHEAAHQMVEQRIYGEGFPSSLWVAEGLATYFGYTYLDDRGRFQPGQIGGKSVSLEKGSPPKPGLEARKRLQSFRRSLRDWPFEDEAPFETVVRVEDPSIFYVQSSGFFYPASWILVHFLMHADDGAHADAFARYVTLEAKGQGGPDAFFREIGMNGVELDTAVQAYLKKLKAR